ncbi:hypothetical protein [Celeribacter ethanolicus]|nr:hypothetical protein [Celeribacter ethanolicus]
MTLSSSVYRIEYNRDHAVTPTQVVMYRRAYSTNQKLSDGDLKSQGHR